MVGSDNIILNFKDYWGRKCRHLNNKYKMWYGLGKGLGQGNLALKLTFKWNLRNVLYLPKRRGEIMCCHKKGTVYTNVQRP